MESEDWLASYADAGVRDRLIGMRLEAGGSGAAKPIKDPQELQKDAAKTAEIASNVVTGPKGVGPPMVAMNPAERREALDDLGFSRQLVFTTTCAPRTSSRSRLLRRISFARSPSMACSNATRICAAACSSWAPAGRPISSGGSTARGRLAQTDPVVGRLSMQPSDYIRRAVRFPEGTKNPIARFETGLANAGFGDDVRDKFYRRNFEDMFVGA